MEDSYRIREGNARAAGNRCAAVGIACHPESGRGVHDLRLGIPRRPLLMIVGCQQRVKGLPAKHLSNSGSSNALFSPGNPARRGSRR